ncbi:hypothetical protein FRX31_023928 [Thalictrum thalictroides]|uniref:Uncharacterized protein n=1 Tax=Thalictrum thalictroides TaxID=46969 RepID=A0A7J6VN18_THATH|nr:hypothetical protein FRX31_023928 [Thalictrum thalictroides]
MSTLHSNSKATYLHRPPAARLPHPFTTGLPSQTSIPVAGSTVWASLSSPWTFLTCSANPTG